MFNSLLMFIRNVKQVPESRHRDQNSRIALLAVIQNAIKVNYEGICTKLDDHKFEHLRGFWRVLQVEFDGINDCCGNNIFS